MPAVIIEKVGPYLSAQIDPALLVASTTLGLSMNSEVGAVYSASQATRGFFLTAPGRAASASAGAAARAKGSKAPAAAVDRAKDLATKLDALKSEMDHAHAIPFSRFPPR